MALSVLRFGVRSAKLMERGNLVLMQQLFAKKEASRSMVSGCRIVFIGDVATICIRKSESSVTYVTKSVDLKI